MTCLAAIGRITNWRKCSGQWLQLQANSDDGGCTRSWILISDAASEVSNCQEQIAWVYVVSMWTAWATCHGIYCQYKHPQAIKTWGLTQSLHVRILYPPATSGLLAQLPHINLGFRLSRSRADIVDGSRLSNSTSDSVANEPALLSEIQPCGSWNKRRQPIWVLISCEPIKHIASSSPPQHVRHQKTDVARSRQAVVKGPASPLWSRDSETRFTNSTCLRSLHVDINSGSCARASSQSDILRREIDDAWTKAEKGSNSEMASSAGRESHSCGGRPFWNAT